MKTDKFGQLIFTQEDVISLYMQGLDVSALPHELLVDESVNLELAADILDHVPVFVRHDTLSEQQSIEQWDRCRQSTWFMPPQYQTLDIAAHVLSLCDNDAELQRCGHELMLFQERNLFDLLRYLKYLVDVMTENRLIWGVGRGSSVASYVLYKLRVHRVDSLYYDLDPAEFLR